jgi:hypothetical protein
VADIGADELAGESLLLFHPTPIPEPTS